MHTAVSLILNGIAMLLVIFCVLLVAKAAMMWREERQGIAEWEERGWSDEELQNLKEEEL